MDAKPHFLNPILYLSCQPNSVFFLYTPKGRLMLCLDLFVPCPFNPLQMVHLHETFSFFRMGGGVKGNEIRYPESLFLEDLLWLWACVSIYNCQPFTLTYICAFLASVHVPEEAL